MNARQTQKLNAHRTLSAALEDFKSTWTPLSAFKRAVGNFNDCLEEIDDLSRIQADRSGAGIEKALCLVQLATQAHTIASSVGALAADTQDSNLAARVNFSRSDLTRGREAQIITRCENIHAAATEHLESLQVEYGINQAKLNALQQKIAAFRQAQPRPRRTRDSASDATRRLHQCFSRVDKILREKLDKLVVQFETTAPDFYNEYTSGRRIGSRVRRGANAKPDVAPGTVPVPKVA